MMVAWRESSLQILVALIGSSLIVTALTSLSSYFSKPSLDIYVEVGNQSLSRNTTYRIFLVNNGYSTAKDVRLTMTYPNVTVDNATWIYRNENFSLAQTSNSVVAFSSRLSTGVKIGIQNNITDKHEHMGDFITANGTGGAMGTQSNATAKRGTALVEEKGNLKSNDTLQLDESQFHVLGMNGTLVIDKSAVINNPSMLPFRFSVEDYPAHGTVSIIGSLLKYRPTSDYRGSDSFSFKATAIDPVSNKILIDPVSHKPLSSNASTVNVVIGPKPIDSVVYSGLQDFDTDSHNDYYNHSDPFSISVTYDVGGNTYHPPPTFEQLIGVGKLYYDTDALKFFIPIVIGILLIGIAHRHRKKNQSKFASDVLRDIETAEKHLAKAGSNAIISLKDYEFSVENELQQFDNYEDYKLIDNFYMGLKQRELKILNPNLSNPNEVLKEENEKCYKLAKSAHADIDWKKFHKLDLILLIPLIFLGSYFITLICEGVPIFIYSLYLSQTHTEIQMPLIISVLVTVIILRSTGTFFIMRLILPSVHGRSISVYLFPRLYRKKYFIFLSAGIMGIPSLMILVVVVYLMIASHNFSIAQSQLQIQMLLSYATTIIVLSDTARMLLITWIVSKYPKTRKKETTLQIRKTASE